MSNNDKKNTTQNSKEESLSKRRRKRRNTSDPAAQRHIRRPRRIAPPPPPQPAPQPEKEAALAVVVQAAPPPPAPLMNAIPMGKASDGNFAARLAEASTRADERSIMEKLKAIEADRSAASQLPPVAPPAVVLPVPAPLRPLDEYTHEEILDHLVALTAAMNDASKVPNESLTPAITSIQERLAADITLLIAESQRRAALQLPATQPINDVVEGSSSSSTVPPPPPPPQSPTLVGMIVPPSLPPIPGFPHLNASPAALPPVVPVPAPIAKLPVMQPLVSVTRPLSPPVEVDDDEPVVSTHHDPFADAVAYGCTACNELSAITYKDGLCRGCYDKAAAAPPSSSSSSSVPPPATGGKGEKGPPPEAPDPYYRKADARYIVCEVCKELKLATSSICYSCEKKAAKQKADAAKAAKARKDPHKAALGISQAKKRKKTATTKKPTTKKPAVVDHDIRRSRRVHAKQEDSIVDLTAAEEDMDTRGDPPKSSSSSSSSSVTYPKVGRHPRKTALLVQLKAASDDTESDHDTDSKHSPPPVTKTVAPKKPVTVKSSEKKKADPSRAYTTGIHHEIMDGVRDTTHQLQGQLATISSVFNGLATLSGKNANLNKAEYTYLALKAARFDINELLMDTVFNPVRGKYKDMHVLRTTNDPKKLAAAASKKKKDDEEKKANKKPDGDLAE